jgi:hypothetical protein
MFNLGNYVHVQPWNPVLPCPRTGSERGPKLHRPHCRSYDNGLVLLWLAYAFGRPSENYTPVGVFTGDVRWQKEPLFAIKFVTFLLNYRGFNYMGAS